jgi:hypothetical protein
MADFGRGIKAGVVTGIVYLVICAILGAIYQNDPLSVPNFMYGAGLTFITWRGLADFSSVISLLFLCVYRGLVFGAVFAALYNFLPGTASVKKGVVLSAFLCIVAVVGAIYTTPGWPTYGWIPDGAYYSGTLDLSSPSLALAGIISALVFGALTGFLWDRFRGKELTAERKGRPALLGSFILGLAIWVLFTVMFLPDVIIRGVPAVSPESWFDLLAILVVFLGLPGWILARAAWKKTKVDKSGFKWGVAGGVMMALTGIMMLPGVLAITGGVLSGGKAASESSTAEALMRDKIARTGEQKRRTNINRNLILLITGMTMLTITIIVGYTTSISPTPTPIEIRDWYDLNAIRDNLGGSYLLMNNLDFTTAGYEELASETANQGKGWQPIGTFTPYNRFIGFKGTFDGQGYEIRDLFINCPDEGDAVGLFGFVAVGGVIKNLGVMNADVTGSNNTGDLVGVNVQGTLSNSYSTGSVTGNSSVGGLVGFSVSGNVSNSYSTSSVTGERDVGGLVGVILSGTVSSSYSIGSVTGNSSVGGLVGFSVSGNVSNSYSSSSVSGDWPVGGLVGSSVSGNVSNSYSTGSVTGNNCTGGLVGGNGGTVSNSFWDNQTSGQATSAGGTGKNTTQMQDIATFLGAGWNITAVNSGETNPAYIWNIVDSVNYPLLSWFLGCPQGPPTQMTTRTTPSGYFELTVSPAEVYANVGEPVEIRCSIDCLINTVVEISSVDVLLFDSYGSMIREQAMTKDSYWSAHTAYTIVGDEAYYKLKVNFSFLLVLGESGEYTWSGEYTEYTAHSFPIVVNQNR